MFSPHKYNEITNTPEIKITRQAARGFIPFVVDLYNELQESNHIELDSLMELGIAGAGSQRHYAISGMPNVYGIDIQTPETEFKNYTGAFAHATKVSEEFPQINLMFGTDAYAPETPQRSNEYFNRQGKYDIVIDDAATDWPRMLPSLPTWRDHTKYAYLSFVPDGMGVERWWNMSEEEHFSNLREQEEQGMLIFDFSHFKQIVPGQEKNWNSHYMGIWMPNWELGRKTITKYKEYILCDNPRWNRRLWKYSASQGGDLQRSRFRGFQPIQTDFMDVAFKNTTASPTYVELGIGAGAPHSVMYHTLKSGNVIGVDHTNLDSPDASDGYGIRKLDQLRIERDTVLTQCPGIDLVYNTNAYLHESARKIWELNKHNTFTVVLDDASPVDGALSGDGLVQSWGKHMHENGVIISQTPFGNGTPAVYALSHNEKMCKLEKLSKEQNMVIFDCTTFMQGTQSFRDELYFLPYLAVHVTSAIYQPIFKKYQDYIIFGKENIMKILLDNKPKI